jgi:TolB-like protein
LPESDSGVSHDVFVSYASSDAAVAHAIVEGLERSGLKCWIAPRDVPPGALYADCIIAAINGAKVLVLVLSAHAVGSPHVSKEIERASAKRRPIIALRTDLTPLTPTLEYFLSESQWIDALSAHIEAVTPKLVEAVRRLMARPPGAAPPPDTHPGSPLGSVPQPTSAGIGGPAIARAAVPTQAQRNRPRNLPVMALIAVVVAALGYIAVDKLMLAKRGAPAVSDAAAPAASADSAVAAAGAVGKAGAPLFAPPPHSIAVLPFVNMSGDPKEDYFSDGLSEELLNSLTTIPDLRVAARTSSFFFKGKEVDLTDVAHKLNVGAVLEGSVRKDGAHVRITAQLINAVTGFHLWSHTYDRDLKDILKLQTDIATAVTQALEATLMADAATAIELGGTKNPQAFDAYLRGRNSSRDHLDRDTVLAGIAAFDEAIRLDPGFAKAYASKALSENGFAEYYALESESREHFQRARAAAQKALELTPDLGQAHSAFGVVLSNGFFDFQGALKEHDRAVALSPNEPFVLVGAALFYADIGRSEQAVRMARHAVSLDQLNPAVYRQLSLVLFDARLFRESIEAASRSLSINSKDIRLLSQTGLNQLALGEAEAARKSCDNPSRDWGGRLCLAIAYHKLQRPSDAEAEVAALNKEYGDAGSYQYAQIYAQWGDAQKALQWLEMAYKLKDPGVTEIKVDIFMDPLRGEPRFRDILTKLNMPD